MADYGFTGAAQFVTISQTGTYQITALGAQGGGGGSGVAGGQGASVGGTYDLTAGQHLKIYVGGAGRNGVAAPTYAGAGGGGGGGTFVFIDGSGTGNGAGSGTYTLLMAAGGGGGGYISSAGGVGTTTQGTGSGGSVGRFGGGGGSGVNSNGQSTSNGQTIYAEGGRNRTGGYAGGSGYSAGGGSGGNGGFGGGGGGGYSGGGGGGGFSGGYGGYNGTGGGGGSFVGGPYLVSAAPGQSGANAGNGAASVTAVCFTTGTRIRIVQDAAEREVAVEALKLGDLAVTASGEHRPIRWIGSRVMNCARHPTPEAVQPVRIAAGAFGPGRPARDLRVSPGHAIALDLLGEVLIPAIALVNGATIVQEAVDTVTYWHVALDSHDLLLAEGQAAESYLDMGNRAFFADTEIQRFDLMPDPTPAERTHADFCRPFHGSGSIVEAVRMQVQARAQHLGWRQEWDALADLHLLADGCVIRPEVEGKTARFVVPAAAEDVWLVSRASSPMYVDPHNIHDRRSLGVCVGALKITDGLAVERTIAMDAPYFDEGFHSYQPLEETGTGYRWTTGRARLPADLWSLCRGHFFLRVELADWAIPHWVAPEAAVPMETPDIQPRLRLIAA